MLRLFSTFPGGGPGLGLLLLRGVVGGASVLLGWSRFTEGSPFFGTLSIVGGALLLCGFVTPLAAAVICLDASRVAISTARWTPLPVIFVAAAIFLLGPGSISIDARLFGRREIVIPPSSRPRE